MENSSSLLFLEYKQNFEWTEFCLRMPVNVDEEEEIQLAHEIQLTVWDSNNTEVSYIPAHTEWPHVVNWNMFEWEEGEKEQNE